MRIHCPSLSVLFLCHRHANQVAAAARRMASYTSQGRGGNRNQQWKERPPRQAMQMNIAEGMSRPGPSGRHYPRMDGERRYWNPALDSAGSFRTTRVNNNGVPTLGSSGPKPMWATRAQGFPTMGGSSMAGQVAQIDHEGCRNVPVNDPIIEVKGAWAEAQVRATFYPKFENEKSDQEIRMKMIEVVDNGTGVLEVSLKHSGSLFMYSGDHGGAFAKNSFGNLYTAVGVFVLGRTLEEAWGLQAKEKQREFNDFLERHHMCIAMELVTAVLGDHGQRPLQDYVVVTAVTELRGKPRFYSTPDIISFCRRWRLPSNHVWLFSSRKSAAALFSAYDALCEEGTASSVTKVLDEIADISLPATKSHMEVQGEILEGLVARIVSPRSLERLRQVIQRFPNVTLQGHPQTGQGLREICAANRRSEKEQVLALLRSLGPDMCSDWSDWTRNDGGQASSSSPFFSKFLRAAPADDMTAKLQETIQVLRNRNMPVRFRCRPIVNMEDCEKIQFKMIIHVLADSVFRKYQSEMRHNSGLWPLYRGYFVEVSLFDNLVQASTRIRASDQTSLAKEFQNGLQLNNVEDDVLADEAANLMLKLKFLTYKLRTFLIRNGLSTLFNSGFGAYRKYYLRQMEIWGTSPEKRQALDQFLSEWAGYITRKFKNRKPVENMYLSEAEPFLEQYARRSAKNHRLIGAAGSLVRTEDFLADAEIGSVDDEDKVLEDSYSGGYKETVEKLDTNAMAKAKGLLVFFPGIPGCAKSALCREILNTPGGLGDGKPVHSLMGDLIKGRYWPKLAEERRRQPSVVTLADKNAPNQEVWKQIEEMCQSTSAIGVPVVPDSEGTSSNPFSIDALAIFIFRVLQRVNHPGNLDMNSANPGYVLLMFYNLYEGKDRAEFEASLKRQFGHLVRMPLLKPDRLAMLPSVSGVLMEGLDLFNHHTAKHGKLESTKGTFKAEWARWEKRLKDVLFANADYLNSIQVPFGEAVLSVRQQLEAIAQGENVLHTPVEEERRFRTIAYAAISLQPNEIVDILQRISCTDKAVKTYLSGKCLDTKMKQAHVTLAHKVSHGVSAVAAYGALRGLNVPVELTAFLFSEKICALEAHIRSSGDQEIVSRNEWAHVTVWTAEGTRPKEASTLPQLVHQGKANRLKFTAPFTIVGVVNLL
eukprot:c29187_g1_i1 orf=271-3738(-)